MKRISGLYETIISLENLQLADRKARKGKKHQLAVREHMANADANLLSLHQTLAAREFRTSPYHTFKIYEPKERTVFRLPYFPDRIVHHAALNILEPVFVSMFTADTYSCIKGKGIHGAADAVRNALGDEPGTQYCLKLDIRKFYPSVSHPVLKKLLRRKFKDQHLLDMLDEIIDSADGLPIGNYLSQYFANFYLSGFDHWLKEVKKVRYYFRYADDLVILAPDKAYLHQLLAEIRAYLQDHLHLEVKGNYQVFPVAARGIDFVGYKFYHTHTLLRKRIKQNMFRSLAKKPSMATFASYYGWLKHCNGHHLLNKLIHEKFQRPGYPGLNPQLFRRQNKDRPDIKPGDHCPGLQDRTVNSKAGNRMPHPADRSRRTETCRLHRS